MIPGGSNVSTSVAGVGGVMAGSAGSVGSINISSMLQLGASQDSEADKLDKMMVNSTEMYRGKSAFNI